MPVWSEDFAAFRIEEVLRCQSENRAWSKALRQRNADLVNSRLAKLISQDAYVSDRKLVHEDTAECRRRAAILDTQIGRRMLDSPLRDN